MFHRAGVHRVGIDRVFAFALALLLSASGTASAQHLDILVARSAKATVIGSFDFDGGGTAVTRVFTRPLALDSPVYVGSDPGFVGSSSGLPAGWLALPANAPVTFEILWERSLGRNLLHWDGSGAVSFEPPPDDEVLVIDQNGCAVCAQAFADGADEDVPGFVLGTTAAGGVLHRHHDFFLLGDLGLSDLPTPGVYLTALRVQAGTLDWSTPLFLLFGANASGAQLTSAANWVDANLVFPACSDGTDNDGDGLIDWAGGPNFEPKDPGCKDNPNRGTERPPSCGLGFEIAVLAPLWWRLRRRRRSSPFAEGGDGDDSATGSA